jgi:hypothetical protein
MQVGARLALVLARLDASAVREYIDNLRRGMSSIDF